MVDEDDGDPFLTVVRHVTRAQAYRHTSPVIAGIVLREWVRLGAGDDPRVRLTVERAAQRRLHALPATRRTMR